MNEKNDRADAVFVFGRFPPYSEGANFHPFFVSDVKLFFRGGPAPRMVCTQVAGRQNNSNILEEKTIAIFWVVYKGGKFHVAHDPLQFDLFNI